MLNIVKWWVHIVKGSFYVRRALFSLIGLQSDKSRSLKISPTRTCVEIELPPSVPFIISLLAFRPLHPSANKSFLHVESRSNWASCIVGPYRFKGLQTVFLTKILFLFDLPNVRFARHLDGQLEILRKSSSSFENWSKQKQSILFRSNWFEELRTFDG